MNREDLNWLLETIKGAETAERFVLTQYERGRISLELMADVAQEMAWIEGAANRLFTTLTCDSKQDSSSELPIALTLGAVA